MWTDPGWFIHQLEVRIWFWSSAAWPPTFLYLSFSTLYFSSLWRTDTTVLPELNKPPVSIKPPSNGPEINNPYGGLKRGFKVISWKIVFKTHELILKSNSRNTNWTVDPFTQVTSTEHMAWCNIKSIFKSGKFCGFPFTPKSKCRKMCERSMKIAF